MRLRNLLKDKHGAMYIKACVLVIIITMVFSVAFYFTTTMVRAKAQRKDAIQTLDQYTQLNAIDIYNSIKNHNDKTDTLDSDVFVASLCSSQGLQVSGDTWVAYTEDGGERYRISDIQMKYSVDNTTKITVSYTLTVPLNFLGNTVWIDIPVSINTSLNAKFDETDNSGTATYIVKHWKMNTDVTTYSLDKVWTLTGTVGDKVTPPVKTYEGFVSPATQTVTADVYKFFTSNAKPCTKEEFDAAASRVDH